MQARAIFWQALTPVHPGTGQDSSSVIDLPVAREAATKFPIIPASSLKGVLRNGAGLDKDDLSEAAQKARKIYGYAGKLKSASAAEYTEASQAGQLTLTDARVLLLPVRSYAGTFALITCPLVLQRYLRDQKALGLTTLQASIPVVGPGDALLSSQTQLKHTDKVILEDIDLDAKPAQAQALASELSQQIFGTEETYFTERFALVHNDVFGYFCETGMEVIARVRLENETKTVVGGALWYEEAVPAEAVFSNFALSTSGDFGEVTQKPYIQIGGKGSVGRGLLKRLGGE